jgi:hypothetical protein
MKHHETECLGRSELLHRLIIAADSESLQYHLKKTILKNHSHTHRK